MAKINDTVFCDGCGAEITWSPVLKGNQKFCCKDCSEGLECHCGDRMELEDDRRGSGYEGLAPD